MPRMLLTRPPTGDRPTIGSSQSCVAHRLNSEFERPFLATRRHLTQSRPTLSRKKWVIQVEWAGQGSIRLRLSSSGRLLDAFLS